LLAGLAKKYPIGGPYLKKIGDSYLRDIASHRSIPIERKPILHSIVAMVSFENAKVTLQVPRATELLNRREKNAAERKADLSLK